MTGDGSNPTELTRVTESAAPPEPTETTDIRTSISPSTPATDPTYRLTLADVDHTHPYTDEAFGEAVVYQRGPIVAADGGQSTNDEPEPTAGLGAADGSETAAVDGTADRNGRTAGEESEGAVRAAVADRGRMGGVDHVPPDDGGANWVHRRGGEGSRDGR